MTSLDAMTITGVRSVSPESVQGIRFFKPLTLIVGENGAGKTTIIECLKYVCTGSFPPASGKGSAFVHDPKLKGANEVTAQVRLRLHSANDVTFWATRTSKVKAASNGKKSFQSVESKLDMKTADNTRKAVATTCASVTSGIADLMGVSTAVLEYVIFCHQEESNWPLGEPKELKVRFDEIFAVSRYTKAMEEIKKARKRFVQEVKVLEEQLKMQNVRREQAGVLIAEIKAKEESRLALTSDIERQQFSINKLTSERKHARELIKHLKSTFDELQRLATLEQQAQISIEQFGQSQNEFSEMSLDELLERRENLQMQLQEDKAKQEGLGRQIQDLSTEIQQIDSERLTLTHKHASVNEHLKKLPTLSTERTELAHSFLRSYPPVFKDFPLASTISSSSSLPSTSIAQIVSLANEYIPKIQKHVATVTEAGVEQANKLDNTVQEKNQRLAHLQGLEELLRSRITSKEQELQQVSDDLAKARTALGATQGETDGSKYSAALLRLQELDQDSSLPQLLIDIRIVEVHQTLLEHHAETLRQWTRYTASISQFETRIEHYLDRQNSHNNKLNTQLPLLNDALVLFKPYAPPEGDALTEFLPSFGSSAILTPTEMQDPKLISKLAEAVDARIKIMKRQTTQIEEEMFNLNSQQSSLNIAIEKLSTDLAKASKSLDTKKEVFLRKFRLIPRIEASAVDNIKDFFSKDIGQADIVLEEEDDLIILSGTGGIEMQNGRSSSQPSSLPIDSSQASASASAMIQESILFTSLISATKDELQRTETRCAVLRASKDMYDNLLQHVADKSECPLCGTGVHESSEHRRIKDRVSTMMDLIPSQLAEAEEQLTYHQLHLESLESLAPLWADICEKYSSYPIQQKQLSQKKAEKHAIAKQIATVREQVEEASSTFKQLLSIQSTLMTLIRELGEMQTVHSSIEEQIALREAVMRPNTPAPSSISGDEFELDPSIVGFLDYNELASLKAHEIDSLANQASQLLKTTKMRYQSMKTELESRQHERKECETVVSKYQAEFVATTQLNAAITVNEEQVAKIQDELSSLQKEMDEVVPSIQEANEDYIAAKVERDRVSQEQKARANKYREQHDNFSASLAKLDSAHKAVVELESQLHHADALQYESEMAYLKDKSEHLKLRLRELEQSLAMLKAHDESSRRRALQDAIQCRTLMQQRQEYEAQITQHRTIAEGQTPEQLEAKIEALDKKIDAEKHLRSSNQGKCESLAKDVAKKRAELLAQSKSGDADAEWTKVFVQLETTKLAANDLAISQDVLDKALMKYHSSKMSDINQILKELWESTYQGNDIDYVKIVAENDEAVPSASKVQKNFNYRVVMVKGGVELDMRGRCSAGQKVLASLMIRMALAETFCLNCGILALDEPTSNLDQANVESLAESLRRVIEVRQKQSNFQIIIITHDEEFVKVIGRNSWTDEYYKVKKTPDQYSVIAKKSMRELK